MQFVNRGPHLLTRQICEIWQAVALLQVQDKRPFLSFAKKTNDVVLNPWENILARRAEPASQKGK